MRMKNCKDASCSACKNNFPGVAVVVAGFATEKEMLEALDPPTGLSVNNRIAGVVLPDIGDISELNGVLSVSVALF